METASVSMDTGHPTHPLFKSMRKGMGRLVGLGARADNATAHGYSGNADWGQAQDCLPLREKRAARVRNGHAVHRIPASTPAAYHSQELALAPPDRDDDPDGAGHSRSRSRMPDLEWLS